jgi:threonine dehydrogenase-like Zn-dependent dehydrogenase
VGVPQALGTLVKLPADQDAELLASLLTLSDVFCVGHHACVTARVGPRTAVTVIGDGAVGLSAVLAAKRLGAEPIILMGRHTQRTDLGREFGATDVVPERGAEGIERVRELTGGDGTQAVRLGHDRVQAHRRDRSDPPRCGLRLRRSCPPRPT